MDNNVKSNGKINVKLLALIAGIILVVAAVIVVIFILPKDAKAEELNEKLELGDKYLAALEYEQAIAVYMEAIEIDPKCEEAYFAFVVVYVATGDYEAAEDILDKAESKLGSDAVKAKREEVNNKKNYVEPETTTQEPETTTAEPETTTSEPETTTEPETT